MKKVLITGGAGYLGSVLTELLLSKGYHVTVVDSLMYNQISLLPYCGNKNFEFINEDIISYLNAVNLSTSRNIEFHEFDIIIPLAAIVGAPACDVNPPKTIEINYKQIEMIVGLIKNHDVKLMMPNTNSQYGSSDTIITEDSPFNPLSLYAKTKCDAEETILKSGNGICLRLATVFGVSPRMRTDLLVNNFVYKALTDEYLVLFESKFKRNYIHVKDIANTFLFCIENYNKMNNNVYNVGLSDANLSKMELALKIKEHIPNLVILEEEFKEDKDKRNYIVSNEKIESLGWKPKHTIDDGIVELMKAYKIVINLNNKNFTNL